MTVAVHDGHLIRPEVAELLALTTKERLREEDPGTGTWAEVCPTRMVVDRSRFEVDLNRKREAAVYRGPEDCWGLDLWKAAPDQSVRERSLRQYDHFYASLREVLLALEREHGRFVVFDLHTYNHRRDGAKGEPSDPGENPQVNLGTASLDRKRWAPVVETFITSLKGTSDHRGSLLPADLCRRRACQRDSLFG